MNWFKRTLALQMVLCMLIGGTALATGESGKTSEDYEPLWSLAEPLGFRMGTCYSYSQMVNKKYLSVISRHFNSVTPTNELKAYSLLNINKTKQRDDGMPGMDFTQADGMLKWAQNNGINVRGHVLVWDAYMTDWFFREGYNANAPYADAETIRARLAYYIQEVITHCEENFPGVVYCWDVVNEAVGDSSSEYTVGDVRHLRTVRNGAPNIFRELAGDDYVEYAFLCARNTVDSLGADIHLFYNDYNAFQTEKRSAICALLSSINSYATDENGNPRKLADGVGMQGYIGGYGTQNGCMNTNDITLIRNAIETYAAMGLQVQITEMAVRNYSDNDIDVQRHAEFYAQLFDMFRDVNNGENKPLTCVAIWGIEDCPQLPTSHYTWKLNSPYGGLITEKTELKTAFDSVYHSLSK